MNAAFFDMDGTLIDSKADLCATVNHTRRDLGLEERSVDEIIAHVGLGARYLLAHAIPERSDDVERLWEIFMSHYGEHMLESVTLYPGVAETLEALVARGWRLGVNTAKPSFATHAILERLGIANFFGDAVIAGGDCAEMKPSALPLRECAARMRGHRSTCRHSDCEDEHARSPTKEHVCFHGHLRRNPPTPPRHGGEGRGSSRRAAASS